MDKLSDLPVKNGEMTKQEENVMKEFFGESDSDSESSGPSTKRSWMEIFKTAVYTVFLFLVLTNPFIDGVLCMVPYCDNQYSVLAFKCVIFMIVMVLILKYVS